MPVDATIVRNALGGLRIWVFGIWLVYLAITPCPQPIDVASFPFDPPLIIAPLARLWQQYAAPWVSQAFYVALILCVAGAALGVRPYRSVALSASVLLTLFQGLGQSFGNGNHTETALLLATYPLAIFPAADGLSWPPRLVHDRSTGLYQTGVVLIGLLVLLPYTASASYRAAHHPFATCCTDALVRWAELTNVEYWSGAEVPFNRHGLLAGILRLLSPVATVFEIGAPLALCSRRWRRLWIAFVVSFHAGIALVMHVVFLESMLLVPGVLVAIDRVACCDKAGEEPPR